MPAGIVDDKVVALPTMSKGIVTFVAFAFGSILGLVVVVVVKLNPFSPSSSSAVPVGIVDVKVVVLSMMSKGTVTFVSFKTGRVLRLVVVVVVVNTAGASVLAFVVVTTVVVVEVEVVGIRTSGNVVDTVGGGNGSVVVVVVVDCGDPSLTGFIIGDWGGGCK